MVGVFQRDRPGRRGAIRQECRDGYQIRSAHASAAEVEVSRYSGGRGSLISALLHHLACAARTASASARPGVRLELDLAKRGFVLCDVLLQYVEKRLGLLRA